MPNSGADLSTSLIRTIVPIITGLILSGLFKLGVEVEPGPISVAVDAVVTGGWYTLVRSLEQKFPNVGLLLGSRTTPTYSEPSGSSWSSKKPPVDGSLSGSAADIRSEPQGGGMPDEDPAELYAVPEDEQLDEDPGLDPDHTAGAPADLTHVPEGDDDDIVYFDDDEQAEPDPDHLLDGDLDEHQEVPK